MQVIKKYRNNPTDVPEVEIKDDINNPMSQEDKEAMKRQVEAIMRFYSDDKKRD